ncbi:DUF2993 domain-containing protein [Leptolyngbya sp. FACHB-16]|uniref:LmeA family phospholipid-binding protein n=1 Tax=unclassified Leptolyngbya TaxID=2650499 RepID=UPI001686CA7F|nr:DUF2993 domain-containing protein [Leptolyngbya sp. FACHB-16]MBD2157400.1 DUF2993 domain-containing protein [Leptolyngbya sp. FACHB-16]
MPDLGKQALNKVVEVGISSQLDEVEDLKVDVESDPMKLMSGEVESVEIEGKGMVMQKDLRVEEMQVKTGNVAVNPLKAAFGQIELSHPTNATVQVTLTEADINRAFNSQFIQEKLQNLDVHVNGERVTVDTQRVEFGLPGECKVAIKTDVVLRSTGETKQTAFTAVPRMEANGQQVVLEDVQYEAGQELSPELTDALLAEARELLDLRNFELDGMVLRLRHLDVQSNRLLLEAEAQVDKIPT